MFETSKQEKLVAQQRRELQPIRTPTPMLSELRLLRQMMFCRPVCHVRLLSSFWMLQNEESFYGYWIDDTATCDYVSRSSVPDKARFESGFIMGHAGDSHMQNVWVGNKLKHLRAVKATLGIKVTDAELRHLVHSGESVYFVQPGYPEHCPVHRLDTQQAREAGEAGYTTELKTPFANKKLHGRPVQAGDQLVVLPLGGDWVKSLRFFPADWLPADQYRRV